LGRGLGGIGVGQLIDEVTLYNAADNLFIFLWVTFGLPGLIVIYLIVRGGLISERGAVGDSSLYFCLSVSVLILGIFLSGIESGIISCMLGALAGRGLFRKTITVAETASRRARLVSRTPALVWRHTP
jgi:O-antigen ligase